MSAPLEDDKPARYAVLVRWPHWGPVRLAHDHTDDGHAIVEGVDLDGEGTGQFHEVGARSTVCWFHCPIEAHEYAGRLAAGKRATARAADARARARTKAMKATRPTGRGKGKRKPTRKPHRTR